MMITLNDTKASVPTRDDVRRAAAVAILAADPITLPDASEDLRRELDAAHDLW
jgi:hypothetical protein